MHAIDVFIGFIEGSIRVFASILELLGAFVIVYTGILIFLRFVILRFIQSCTDIRLRFGRGLALGLEFQLGGEILRTVSVREFSDLAIIAALIVLRALIAILIHWEIEHDARMQKDEK